MANVVVNIVSIEPKPGRVHEVTYEYTITLNDEECARKASFNLEVELTGVDIRFDDQLGTAIDKHTVNPLPDVCEIKGTKSFPAATNVLNEDWGDDEIRIDLHVTDVLTNDSDVFQSPEFSGNF